MKKTLLEAFQGDKEKLEKIVLSLKPGERLRITNAGKVVISKLKRR